MATDKDLKLSLKITADASDATGELKQAEAAVKGVGDAAKQAGQASQSGLGQAERAADELAGELGDTAREAGKAKQELSGAGDAAGRAGDKLKSTSQDASSVSDQLARARSELLAFIGINLGAGAVKDVAALADVYNNLQARVKLAAGGAAEGNVAFQQLFEIANRTQQPVQAVGELYARVGQSLRDLGLSTNQTLQFTETLAQTFRVSGASAEESKNAIIQLAQGLAVGALRGDEFNSVAEQSPRLMQALADSLGVTRGELRAMAADGKITADVITRALADQASQIGSEYAQLPQTISGSVAQLKNELLRFIGDTDDAIGVSEKLAAVISVVATNVDNLSEVMIALAGGAAAKKVLALKSIELGAISTSASLAGLRTATLALGTAMKGLVLPALFGLAITQADVLGEKLAEMTTGIGKLNAEIAAQRRQQISQELDGLNKQIDASLQYANVRIKTAAEFSALSDAEKTAYLAQLKGLEELKLAEHGRETRVREIGAASDESVQKQLEGLQAVRNAHELLGQSGSLALEKAREAAAGLKAELAAVEGEASKLTDDAIAKLLVTGVPALAQAKEEAGRLGREFLAARDSAERLVLGEQFSKANESVKSLADQIQILRAEQFQRLGVDVDAVLTGIDAKAKGLLATFASLAADSSTDAKLIQAAFTELLAKLDTPQELEALKASLASVQNPAFNAAKAVGEIEKKLKDVAAQADPTRKALEEAFETLGITSSATLAEAARKAEDAYNTIRKNGLATAGDLDAAFAAYAQSALDAAQARGGAALQEAEAMLRGRVATEAQREALDDLIDRYPALGDEAERAGNASEGGGRRGARALREQASAADAAGAAQIRLADATQKANEAIAQKEALLRREGLDPRAIPERDGGSAGIDLLPSQAQFLSGDDKTRLQALARQLQQNVLDLFYDANRNLSSTGVPGANGIDNQRALANDQLQRLTQQLLQGGAAADAARADLNRQLGLPTAPPAQQAPQANKPGAEQPTRRTEVVINLNGQRFTGLFEDNAADALVRALERAQSISAS